MKEFLTVWQGEGHRFFNGNMRHKTTISKCFYIYVKAKQVVSGGKPILF